MSGEVRGPISRAFDVTDYLRERGLLPFEPGPLRDLAREVLIRAEPTPAQVGEFVGGVLRGFFGASPQLPCPLPSLPTARALLPESVR